MDFTTLISGGAFFECPRWRDGRLWVSDFWQRQVLAISLDGTASTVAEVPASPAGLGWLPDGTMVAVSMMDNKLLRVADGAELASLAGLSGGGSNDLVVDAAGRAYVGTVDFMAWGDTPPTNLVRVDPDGSVSVAADGLLFPNGMVIDGDTLIVAESMAGRLTAFDLGADGSLRNRRVWATIDGNPDGIALDASGAVWVADAGGNRALRVRAGGEVLEEISTGELGVFACALGGADGHTLFLCASPTFDPQEAVKIRQARILTCSVATPSSDGGRAPR